MCTFLDSISSEILPFLLQRKETRYYQVSLLMEPSEPKLFAADKNLTGSSRSFRPIPFFFKAAYLFWYWHYSFGVPRASAAYHRSINNPKHSSSNVTQLSDGFSFGILHILSQMDRIIPVSLIKKMENLNDFSVYRYKYTERCQLCCRIDSLSCFRLFCDHPFLYFIYYTINLHDDAYGYD